MKGNCSAVWIPPRLLGSRLDGNFNHPMAIAARAKILQRGSVKIFEELTRKIACGPFGSTLTASEHDPNGEIVLIQPTDISEGGFTIEPGWKITEATLREKELPLYPSGTLLFARKGIYPHCAALPNRAGKATLGSSMIGAVVDDKVADSYYLEAFFRGVTGQQVLFSLQMITASPTIGTSELAEALIPYADLSIQWAIGNKVRAAEKLREQATACATASITKINSVIGYEDLKAIKPSPDGACGYFVKQVLATDLAGYFGAQLYAPKRQRAVQLVRSARSPVTTLGAQGIRVKSKGKSNQSRTHIDPMNIYGSNGYWDEARISDGSDVVLAKPGYVLFLRMRPYLNKTTIVDIEETVSTSPEFLIYKFEERDDAFYATLCLRQPWALAQVAEIATGDRPRVDGEFIDEIILPWPDHGERSQIGQLYKESFAACRQADTLAKAAIADVEHLIEGKLDEAACLEEGRKLAEEFGFEKP